MRGRRWCSVGWARGIWFALFMAWPGSVAAQEGVFRVLPPLGTDVRVSIRAPDRDESIRGALAVRGPAGIVLRDRDGEEHSIALAAVTRVDQYSGRSHEKGALKGLGWGVAIGFVVGGTLSAATYDSDNSPCDSPGCTDSAFGAFLLGGIVTGVAGAAVGTVIGALRGSERWEQVW